MKDASRLVATAVSGYRRMKAIHESRRADHTDRARVCSRYYLPLTVDRRRRVAFRNQGRCNLDGNCLRIQSSDINADCVYFSLDGVTEADTVNPSVRWFGTPRTQYGARDAYAMLVATKLSGSRVSVQTTGAMACGYAGVRQLWMQ